MLQLPLNTGFYGRIKFNNVIRSGTSGFSMDVDIEIQGRSSNRLVVPAGTSRTMEITQANRLTNPDSEISYLVRGAAIARSGVEGATIIANYYTASNEDDFNTKINSNYIIDGDVIFTYTTG